MVQGTNVFLKKKYDRLLLDEMDLYNSKNMSLKYCIHAPLPPKNKTKKNGYEN
jgi:hypothetical protein